MKNPQISWRRSCTTKCLHINLNTKTIKKKTMKTKGAISQFIDKYYLHFNAAALVDAAKGYEVQLENGAKMMVTLAGAMSTGELGKIFAEMIRRDKVQIISCRSEEHTS